MVENINQIELESYIILEIGVYETNRRKTTLYNCVKGVIFCFCSNNNYAKFQIQ